MSPYVHSEGREAFNGQAFFSALPRVNGETKAHVSGVACDDGVDEVMAHFIILVTLDTVGATFEEGRGSGKCAGEVSLFPSACRAHVRAA